MGKNIFHIILWACSPFDFSIYKNKELKVLTPCLVLFNCKMSKVPFLSHQFSSPPSVPHTNEQIAQSNGELSLNTEQFMARVFSSMHSNLCLLHFKPHSHSSHLSRNSHFTKKQVLFFFRRT